jgi:cation transport regulator
MAIPFVFLGRDYFPPFGGYPICGPGEGERKGFAMATKSVTLDLIERLPRRAQEIYEEAFGIAYDEDEDDEEGEGELFREEWAHRTAWAAVKRQYEKTRSGRWHKKKASRIGKLS